MLSKNNRQEQFQKQEPKKQRFAIKKLTVGVASVLIGFSFLGANASANTDEPDSGSGTSPDSGTANDNVNDTSAKNAVLNTASTTTPANQSGDSVSIANTAEQNENDIKMPVADDYQNLVAKLSAMNPKAREQAMANLSNSIKQIQSDPATLYGQSFIQQTTEQPTEVSSFEGFSQAFMDPTVHRIKLTQSLDFSGLNRQTAKFSGGLNVAGNYEFNTGNKKGIARDLVIEGDGADKTILNMGQWFISTQDNNSINAESPWKITLKDLTLKSNVGRNFSPFFFANTTTKNLDGGYLKFDGVTAELNDSPLLQSDAESIRFAGNNTINSTLSHDWSLIFAKDFTLEDNATLTFNVKSGSDKLKINDPNGIVRLSGRGDASATIGKDAQLTINSDVNNYIGFNAHTIKGSTLSVGEKSKVDFNMADGHSTAIWMDNLNINPNAKVDILTYQNNNASKTSSTFGSGFDWFHAAPVMLGFSGDSTLEIAKNAQLNMIRPTHLKDGSILYSNGPMITFGDGGENGSRSANRYRTLNVEENGILNIQDGATYPDHSKTNNLQYNYTNPADKDVYGAGMIDVWGINSSAKLTFNNPGYINLQHTGSQPGNLFRLEGNTNQDSAVVSINGTNVPFAQWNANNNTDKATYAWHLKNFKFAAEGQEHPYYYNGNSKSTDVASLAQAKNWSVTFENGKTYNENQANASDTNEQNFLNSLNPWTAYRWSFGTLSTIAGRDEPHYGVVTVKTGETKSVNPSFTDENDEAINTPEGTEFTIDNGTPDWATINKTSGKLTITPTVNGVYNIPVTVTYKDGSQDKVIAPIVVTDDDTQVATVNDKGAVVLTSQTTKTHKNSDNQNLATDATATAAIKSVDVYTYDKDGRLVKDTTDNTKAGVTATWSHNFTTKVTGTTPTATSTANDGSEAVNVKYSPESVAAQKGIVDTTQSYVLPNKVDRAGAQAVEGLKAVHNVTADIKDSPESYLDLSALTKANNAEIATKDGKNNIEWVTKPDVSEWRRELSNNVSTGLARIHFTDGSYLDVDVPVTIMPNDADKDTSPSQVDTDIQTVNQGSDLPDPKKSLLPISIPNDSSVKFEWDNSAKPDTSKPGVQTGLKIIEKYPDGSSHIVPDVTVIVNANPIAGNVTTNVGSTPDLSKADVAKQVVTNIKDDIAGYPTSIEWKTAPDVTKAGLTTGEVIVHYPSGTDQTVTVPVAVNDSNNYHQIDDKGHTYSFHAQNVVTHKTSDKAITITPIVDSFELSYYKGGQNYSKPFVFTRQADGSYKLTQAGDVLAGTTVTDAQKANIPANKIKIDWTANGNGLPIPGVTGHGMPNTLVKSGDSTATTIYDNGHNTQGKDGYVYPNYSVTVDSSAADFPIFGKGAKSLTAFPSVTIYGATKNDKATAITVNGPDFNQDSDTLKGLIDHSDVDKLTGNQAVKNYTWGTKPTVENGKVTNGGTVRINFNDGTYLDVAVDANKINYNNEASQFTPSYPTTDVEQGKTIDVNPTITKDGKTSTVPAGTSFTTPTDTPSWVKVDGTTGKITLNPDTSVTTGPYNIPVTVIYKDGSTTTVNAPIVVTDKNQTVISNDKGAVVVTVDPTAVKAHETSDKTQIIDAKSAIKSIDAYKITNGKITTTPENIAKTRVNASWTPEINTNVDKATAAGKTLSGEGLTVDLGTTARNIFGNERQTVNTKKFDITAAGAEAKDNLAKPVEIKLGSDLTDAQFKNLVTNNIPADEIASTAWKTKPAKNGNGVIRINFTDKNGSTPTYLDVTIPAKNMKVTGDDDALDPKGQPTTIKQGDKVPDPKNSIVPDSIKNVPSDTTYTWTKGKEPKPNEPGTQNVEVTVTYPDGTQDKVPTTVTVNATPTTKPIRIDEGDTNPDPTPSITNVNNGGTEPTPGYPTNVTWTNGTPDTKTPGKTDVEVTVHYPSGEDQTVKVPVVVTEKPKTQPITVNPGQTPDVTKTVTNIDPSNPGKPSKVEWTDGKVPDTKTPGVTNSSITVTYPDPEDPTKPGETVTTTVPVIVVDPNTQSVVQNDKGAVIVTTNDVTTHKTTDKNAATDATATAAIKSVDTYTFDKDGKLVKANSSTTGVTAKWDDLNTKSDDTTSVDKAGHKLTVTFGADSDAAKAGVVNSGDTTKTPAQVTIKGAEGKKDIAVNVNDDVPTTGLDQYLSNKDAGTITGATLAWKTKPGTDGKFDTTHTDGVLEYTFTDGSHLDVPVSFKTGEHIPTSDSKTNDDTNMYITRTIKSTGLPSDLAIADQTQTVHYVRDGYKNVNGGDPIWNAWQLANDSKDWTAVQTPKVTDSKTGAEYTAQIDSKNVTEVPAETVTTDTKSKTVTVSYVETKTPITADNANPETKDVTRKIIDKLPSGEKTTTQTVSFNRKDDKGNVGYIIDGQNQMNPWKTTSDAKNWPAYKVGVKGYTASATDENNKAVALGQNGLSEQDVTGDTPSTTITITYQKNANTPVKADKDHSDKMEISRTITFEGVPTDKQGTYKDQTQTVKFTRADKDGNIGYQDPATDVITYNPWKVVDGNGKWDAVNVPTITEDDGSVYTPTITVDGKSATSIPEVTVSAGTNDKDDKNTGATKPSTVKVVYTETTTPHKYTEGNGKNDDSNLYVTRTIKYTVPAGQDAIADQVQTVHYIRKDSKGNSYYTDKDGKKTLVDWTLADGQTAEWAAKDVNQITNYDSYVDGTKGTSVAEKPVTSETKDATVQVTYQDSTMNVKPGDPGVTPANPSNDEYKNLFHDVTRTVTIDGQTDPVKQTVHFGRTGVFDKATGKFLEDKYGEWKVLNGNQLTDQTQGKWNEVDVAKAGYTPSAKDAKGDIVALDGNKVPANEAVTATTGDASITVTYTANEGHQTINYVDKDNNPVGTQTINGKTDQTVNVTPDVPDGWEIDTTDPNNKVPSSVTIGATDTPISVTVKHGETTVQPTDPKKPGDKIPGTKDKHYPEGQPTGVDENDLNKTITRTVKIENPDKTVTDKTESISYTRTATIDTVTGKVIKYGNWTPKDSTKKSFTEIDVPEVKGYTPTATKVDAQIPTNDQITNWTDPKTTITYNANDSQMTYTFVDDDNKGAQVGDAVVLNGKTGDKVATGLKVPDNYVLVEGQTFPTDYTFKATNTPVQIHLKHETENADENHVPAGYKKGDFTEDIKRTITVTKPGSTTPEDHSQKITITRTGTFDKVTGKVAFNDWSKGNFEEYDAPTVDGYTPSQAKVEAAKNVTDGYKDPNINITYTANDGSQTINYVDGKGNKVGTQTVPGKTDETVPVTPGIPDGWEVDTTDPNNKVPSSVTIKSTDTPISVTVKHGSTKVTPNNPKKPGDKIPGTKDKTFPKGVDKKDLNKSITRTVTITDPHTGSHKTTETLEFERTATVDNVDGTVTYGNWTPKDSTKKSFTEIDVPEVKGYTPTATKVDAQTPTNDQITNWADPDTKITYFAGSHKMVYTFVDDDNNEAKVGETHTISGNTDEKVDTGLTIPANYKLAKDQELPNEYTFGSADATQTIHLIHETEDVSSTDAEAKKDVSYKVTQTFNGQTKDLVTAEAHFTRTATKDKVTGKVTYGDWTGKQLTIPDTNIAEPGYTAKVNGETSTTNKITGTTLTADSPVSTVYTVTYEANDQHVNINYVDNSDPTNPKTIKTQTLTGKTGTSVTVSVDGKNDTTKLEVPDGWEIVPKSSIPASVSFNGDPKDNADQTVYIQHKKDVTDGRNDQNNPDVYREVTRTINFQMPGMAAQPVTQTVKLYRTKTVDEVKQAAGDSDAVTYSAWQSATTDSATSFKEYNVSRNPQGKEYVPGYTPKADNGVTLTEHDSDKYVPTASALDKDGQPITNSEVNITYDANAQSTTVTYVDENGNEITNPDGSAVTGSHYTVSGKTGEQVDTDVEKNVPMNWKVVGGQNIPTSVTFGSDKPVSPITVKVEHDTEDVSSTDAGAKKDVSYKVTQIFNGQTKDLVNTTAHFTRSATKDKVTGDVTYGTWTGTQQQINDIDIAEPGYTAKVNGETSTTNKITGTTLTADSPVSTVYTVTYEANDQHVNINYVDNSDPTNPKTIKTQTLTGKTGTKVTMSEDGHEGTTKLEVPENWEIVPNSNVPETIPFNGDSKNNPAQTVYIQHKTQDVTDDPSLKNQTTRNVSYKVVDKTDGKTLFEQSATFHRSATKDLVTGDVTYGKWSSDNVPVEAISVAKAGYTVAADNAQIVDGKLPATVLTPDFGNKVITVTYTAGSHQMSYVFHDDTDNKDVKTTNISGNTDQTVDTNLAVPEGYKLAPSQTELPKTYKFGSTDGTTVTIHLVHATQDVDKDHVPAGHDKSEFTKNITRTITVTMPDGTKADKSQTITINRTGTYDEVTKKVTFNDWTTGSFDKVIVPTVDGYTPSQAEVPEVDNVTDGYKDPNINITYTANDSHQTFHYVDENGKDITGVPDAQVTGKTDEQMHGSDVPVPDGWELVDTPSDFTIPAPDKDTAINVKIKHGNTKVTPNDPKKPGDKIPGTKDQHFPAGVDKNDLNKTISRTITIVNPDGKETSITQEASYKRTATVDNVTHDVTYGDWIPADSNVTGFEGVTAPAIPGYTADKTVAAMTPDDETITNWDNSNHNETIRYTAGDQSVSFKFVDDNENGKQVGNIISLGGNTDETKDTGLTIPSGYQLAKGQTIPTEYTFKDQNPEITIHLVHATEPADQNNVPDGYTKDDFTRDINRTIIVTMPDGTTKDMSQTTTITRTGTLDKVTGKVTFNDWTTGNFGKVTVPTVEGYTPSQSEVLAVPQVTIDYQDPDIQISYTKNPTQADQNTPVAQVINVKKGDTPDPKGGIKNAGDLDKLTDPKNPDAKTTYTWKDKTPDTSKPGKVTGTVVVTYPDGSQDEVPVEINVYDTATGTPTEEPEKSALIIVEYKDPTGKVVKTGTKEGKIGDEVEIDIPDGYIGKPVTHKITGNEGVVVVNVVPAPTPADITVTTGQTPDPKTGISNKDKMPDGTKYTWKDKTPDTTTPGDKSATIVVTLPDGTKDEVPVTIHVKDNTPEPSDADKYNPSYPEVVTTPGKTTTTDVHYPDGKTPTGKVTYTKDPSTPDWINVDPSTGKITVTVPEGQPTGVITVPVTVTYPDNSVDHPSVTIVVVSGKPSVTNPKTPTDVINDPTKLPDGTKVEWTKGQEPDPTKKGDSQKTSVTVTVPGHDPIEIPTNVTYTKNPTQADQNDPQTKPVSTPEGKLPSAGDAVTNKPGDPAKPGVPNLPDGTKVEWTNPDKVKDDVTTPGTHPEEITVTYPDGSKDKVTVDVTANEAPETQPIETPIDVVPDASTAITNIKDNVPGYPTKAEWVKTPDVSKPGNSEGTIKVTYSDGSTVIVDHITITVTANGAIRPLPYSSENQNMNKTVTRTIEVVDPVTGKTTSTTQTVKFTRDGQENTRTGEVTYNPWQPEQQTLAAVTINSIKGYTVHVDGDAGELTVTPQNSDLTVKISYEANKPVGQEITVKEGNLPDPSSAIKNVNNLPDGTKYEWKVIPNTDTPGDVDAIVVVTMPDGKKVEVPVTVHVDAVESTHVAADNENHSETVTTTNSTDETAPVAETETKTNTKNDKGAQTNAKKLPQTGNEKSKGTALLGLGLASLTGLLGLGKKKKRDTDK